MSKSTISFPGLGIDEFIMDGTAVSFTIGDKPITIMWYGIIICIGGIVLETIADNQKSAQKKERPDMVATKGLYKMVRCPNYLGEMIFWTGVLISGIGAVSGWQWVVVAIGYIGIKGQLPEFDTRDPLCRLLFYNGIRKHLRIMGRKLIQC